MKLTTEQINGFSSHMYTENERNSMLAFMELSAEVESSSDKEKLDALVGNMQKKSS
jgi:hypothetical protein